MKNYSDYQKGRAYTKVLNERKIAKRRAAVLISLLLYAAVVGMLIAVVSSAVSAFGKESSRYYELERPYRHLQNSASEKSDELRYSSLEDCEKEYEEYIN